MKKIFWLIGLICYLKTLQVKGQDQASFTQFYLNPYLINPSYAGIDGQSAISLIYKKQWINVNGAPTLVNFSLHSPLTDRAAFGVSVTNDKKGLLNNSALLFSLGYNLSVTENSYLRFGLSAGGSWNSVDIDKLDLSDEAMVKASDNHASVAGNAGLSFHSKYFHAGVSMPTLFSPSYISKDAFTVAEVKPFQSLIINASNRFYFNHDKNIFEPYLIYRLNTGLPSQIEAAGVVHLNHTIWTGVSYKQDFGISALGGVKLKNILAIGATFTLKNSGINEMNSPSFEMSLGYLLGARKKGAMAYSFVNTQKEKVKKHVNKPPVNEAIASEQKTPQPVQTTQQMTPAQKAKAQQEEALAKKKAAYEARLKQQQALTANKNQPKGTVQTPKTEEKKTEPVKQANNETKVVKTEPVTIAKNETPQQSKRDSLPVNHSARFNQQMVKTLPVVEEGHPDHEQHQLDRLEVHADDHAEEHNEDHHPHAERHEFVKRGNHAEELDVADYVIGGVFSSGPNAKKYAEGLSKLGYKADYGHLTAKNVWYVYLIQTTDINEAKSLRDKVRKTKMFRDAWLLTVHH